MNQISTILMILVALTVAVVVGLVVVAPDGIVTNPPGTVVLLLDTYSPSA